MVMAREVTCHGQAQPLFMVSYYCSSKWFRKVIKGTTEVSENQTPQACSSIQVSARVRRVPVTLPSGTTST
jgi:hypothetical protein